MNDRDLRLENFLTEESVLEFLGIRKEALDRLRQNEGLPFIKINHHVRLYLEQDLIGWFLSRKATESETK